MDGELYQAEGSAVCTEPPRLQETELTVTKEAKYCYRGTRQSTVKRHWGEGDWRVTGILAEKLRFSVLEGSAQPLV